MFVRVSHLFCRRLLLFRAAYRCFPLPFRRFQSKAKTGLIFKTIIQAPMPAGQKCQDTSEGVFRFVVLYLTRFKDSIRLREGSRLEVTLAAPLLLLFAAIRRGMSPSRDSPSLLSLSVSIRKGRSEARAYNDTCCVVCYHSDYCCKIASYVYSYIVWDQ